ncbi:MAG: hypothetical protein GY920_21310 [Aliivibrio sp.]|nr:hypothetical protein [Aliivibrio sp.]MCP4320898.1 hypothetical protein [Alteromonadales bacterium]
MDRAIRTYGKNGEELSLTYADIEWGDFRRERDRIISELDIYALSDRNISQEMIDYRQFLRDLPSNYPGELANDACDAWNNYVKPQELS